MFNRDPIRSLRSALQCALKRDLLCIEASDGGERRQRPGRRRPREDECDVVLFGQVWSAEALGNGDAAAARHVEQDTTVVIGPAQDACVYAATELLYHVIHPNRRFFLDVASHNMAPKAEAGGYEGRDDAVTEAVDIEVGAMLARLLAQVMAGEPQRAPLVARYLHRYAARFEQPIPVSASPRCTPAASELRH